MNFREAEPTNPPRAQAFAGAAPPRTHARLTGAAGDLPAAVHDCWSTIGVNGNGTCRELQTFVHCRNCPVYSAAGIQLLDRPLTADYRRERTAHYSEQKKLTQPARTSLVLFRLGAEWLALPAPAFQEVAEQRAVHTLPHRRGGIVLGLVNVRGELLICVSLARLLGLETAAPEPGGKEPGRSAHHPPPATHSRLLVANWDGQRIVFPVDEVHGIQRLQNDEIKEPPATVAKSTHACTRGVFEWRGRTVGFLDANAVFSASNRSLT